MLAVVAMRIAQEPVPVPLAVMQKSAPSLRLAMMAMRMPAGLVMPIVAMPVLAAHVVTEKSALRTRTVTTVTRMLAALATQLAMPRVPVPPAVMARPALN